MKQNSHLDLCAFNLKWHISFKKKKKDCQSECQSETIDYDKLTGETKWEIYGSESLRNKNFILNKNLMVYFIS